jgi:hypothetical protein
MTHVIYLKVAKVASQNADMTTEVERTTVTLESGKNFDNFVKHLHVQNYLTSEAEKPRVLKVAELKDGVAGKEVDKTPYVNKVNEALNSVQRSGQAIDYKALSEKQSAKISEMEQRFAAFEDRLKEAEGNKGKVPEDQPTFNRVILEDKAKELDINFKSNIGDKKLLEKIQVIEPDYKL